MKKSILILLLVLIPSIALCEPPEDLDKLQENSIKRFQVSKRKALQLLNGLHKPYPGKPEEAATAFLKDYHRMFKLSKHLSELRLGKIAGYPRGYMIEFNQYFKGLLIYPHGAFVDIDKENHVYGAIANIKEIEESFNTDPAIKPEDLPDVLKNTAPEFLPPEKDPVLYIDCTLQEKPILVYRVAVFKGSKTPVSNLKKLIIDASTGEVLKESSLIIPFN